MSNLGMSRPAKALKMRTGWSGAVCSEITRRLKYGQLSREIVEGWIGAKVSSETLYRELFPVHRD